jgi:hypothetical protein
MKVKWLYILTMAYMGVLVCPFEVFFHWVTSWIEVEWLVGISTKEYLNIDVRTKTGFCQEKNGL